MDSLITHWPMPNGTILVHVPIDLGLLALDSAVKYVKEKKLLQEAAWDRTEAVIPSLRNHFFTYEFCELPF